MSTMQPERAHHATTRRSAHNVSKAHRMFEASKRRARAVDMHKLKSVLAAHNERNAARESASGNRNAIHTPREQGTVRE